MSDQTNKAGDGIHENHWCEHPGCKECGGFGYSRSKALLGALSVQGAAQMITRVARQKREAEALAVRANPRYQILPPSLPRQLVQ